MGVLPVTMVEESSNYYQSGLLTMFNKCAPKLVQIVCLIFVLTSISNAQTVVPEHTLVTITNPHKSSKLTDILVLTVIKGNIIFVDVKTLSNQDYVFTGPPATYSIRITNYTDAGLEVKTETIRIGTIEPEPDPDPDPDPNIPPDRFNNVGQLTNKLVPANFPKKDLKNIYINIAERLEGKEPILLTINQALTELKTQQDNLLNSSQKTDWAKVSSEINKAFQQFVKTRFDLAEFMRAVANGLK